MGYALFAARIVQEPPEEWAIKVEKPEEWAGFYKSVDGVTWTQRGENIETYLAPTEGRERVLRNLRALVKDDRGQHLEAIAGAARALVKASNQGTIDVVGPALTALRDAVWAMDGGPPATCSAALNRQGYEPTEEVEEP